MTNVIVVSGGTSDEREVSLRSGKAISAALESVGYAVTRLDSDSSDEKLLLGDVVFPVLHGVGGEDGEFQERLERLGLRFVGSGSEASKLCMDKGAYRSAMQTAGFLLPSGAAVTAAEYAASLLKHKPHVLKPVDGGSSLDTYIVRDVTDCDPVKIADVFSRHHRLILEELIVGDEVTVGVLGQTVLPVIEIIPPKNEEFDYENKYNGKTQELLPAKHVSVESQRAVQDITLKVHNTAGCRDYSRTDFIITPTGQSYLLETNTIPGLTDQSLFPKMAAATGMNMGELADYLVKTALSR